MKISHDDLTFRYIESIPKGKASGDTMPLVFVLHGRGADANDLADVAPELDSPGGFRFIFPDAPRAFEPYPGMSVGRSWFDGWPPEGDSLRSSRELLLRFIAEVRAKHPDGGRFALTGFSQGGVMSLDTGFRIEPHPAAIVVMSGATFESELPDLRDHREQPVLVVHGLHDDVIPVLAARRLRQFLSVSGIEAAYEEFPMAHQVGLESLAVVRRFLASHL